MKLITALIISLSTAASAVPHSLSRRADAITFGVGQNYLDEWQGFASGVRAPCGISTYGNIYDGVLIPESQELLEYFATNNK